MWGSRGWGRNRVNPIAVEDGTVAGEPSQVDDVASHDNNDDLQTNIKGAANRSLSGRVERKSELHMGLKSLRKSVSRLHRSKSATTKPTQLPKVSPAKERVWLSEENSSIIAGTGGAALGLTPVKEIFKMQNISKKQSEVKGPKYIKNKKQAKSIDQTPCRRRDKRKGLFELNQQESVAPSPKKRAASVSAIRASYTFGKRRTEPPVSSEPEAVTVCLGREVSTGTLTFGSINLSLETSIMNTLYPDGTRSFMTDSFCSDVEMTDVSVVTSEGSPPYATDGGESQAGQQRSNSMRCMRRNPSVASRSSPRLSRTLSLKNSTPTVVLAPPTGDENAVGDESRNTSMSCFPSKNVLEDSYIMAQIDAIMNTPVQRRCSRRQSSKRSATPKVKNAKSRRVSPLDTTWSVSHRESDPALGPPCVRRSRSLRQWGAEGGVVVSGLAGHTPRPRRRRQSYEERLIM